MRTWMRSLLAVTSLSLLVFGGTRAMGEEEPGAVIARGQCSAASIWKLVMAPETGLSAEVNVETGVPDQQWRVTVKYNQHTLIDQIEQTEEDGGFEVRKVENNAVGTDTLRLLAVNLDTNESCRGMIQAEL